jgi:hypothetical protein
MNNEMERISKDLLVVQSRMCLGISLEGARFAGDRARDMNQVPPEYRPTQACEVVERKGH